MYRRQLALSEDSFYEVEAPPLSLSLSLLLLLLQPFTQKTNLIIDSVNGSELLAVPFGLKTVVLTSLLTLHYAEAGQLLCAMV